MQNESIQGKMAKQSENFSSLYKHGGVKTLGFLFILQKSKNKNIYHINEFIFVTTISALITFKSPHLHRHGKEDFRDLIICQMQSHSNIQYDIGENSVSHIYGELRGLLIYGLDIGESLKANSKTSMSREKGR